LIFLVQPLIAKQILPWFGGSAAVWATCLLFFQTALLAGHAYSATRSRSWLSPDAPGARCTRRCWCWRARRCPSSWMPTSGGPTAPEEPHLAASCCCSRATIGLPYFLLADHHPAGGRLVRPALPRRRSRTGFCSHLSSFASAAGAARGSPS
jgi:hypothetical protein